MSEPSPAERKRGRLWVNIGEAAAVLAVIIAALSLWDSHRARVEDDRRAASEAAASRGAEALTLEANVTAGGRHLALKAVEPRQVIESQSYVFPHAVLDHAMEVTAAAPQIDAAWIAPGLARALDAAHAPAQGEARAPVAIDTRFVEDGVEREDRSLYRVGYAWKRHFLGGWEITLQGVAIARRGVAGDPQAVADKAWKAPSAPQ